MAEKRMGKTANKLVNPSRSFLSAEEEQADTRDDDCPIMAPDEVPPVPKLWATFNKAPASADDAISGSKTLGGESSGVDLSALLRRVEALEEDIAHLRKRQEQASQKQEDAEVVRRGQLECISERVYEAEKTQRQVQERTDDAIEKARAAFQKTSSDLEHERSNLMCVITQVNQNFEHLSGELASLTQNVHQELASIQQDVAGDGAMAHDLAQLEEQQANFQQHVQQQMMEMQRQLLPLQQDRFADFHQEVAESIRETRQMVCDTEVQYQTLADSMAHVRSEVTARVKEEVNRCLEEFLSDENLQNLTRNSRENAFRHEVPDALPKFLQTGGPGQGMGPGDTRQEDRRGSDLGSGPPLQQVNVGDSANRWLSQDEDNRHLIFPDEDLGLFTDPRGEMATRVSRLSEQMMNLHLLQQQKASQERHSLQHGVARARNLSDVHSLGQEQSQQSPVSLQAHPWLISQASEVVRQAGLPRQAPEAASLPAPSITGGMRPTTSL